MEFKEQLTVLVVAVLFVLLAADVRLLEVQELAWGGVLTVATLMLVVRPINIFLCARQSDFTTRERLFLSWIAPRGIVAAAMASFFAHELAAHGIAGGNEMRALVFLVIASTVTIQGLSGQWVADLLGVSRPSRQGVVIVGANSLGIAVARLLQHRGISSTLIDSNAQLTNRAARDGFAVVTGSALDERTLQRAKIDWRADVLCITPSEKVNFMVAQLIAKEHKGPEIFLGLAEDAEVTPEMVDAAQVSVFSARRQDLESWVIRCRKGQATGESWRWDAADGVAAPKLSDLPSDTLMAVLMTQDGAVALADHHRELTSGTIVDLLVADDAEETGRTWLKDHGFHEVVDGSDQKI
jgi:hypothetical protein